MLTFGACTTIQDKYQQNTALHWAILAKNHSAITTLVLHGASLDIANAQVSEQVTILPICEYEGVSLFKQGVLGSMLP